MFRKYEIYSQNATPEIREMKAKKRNATMMEKYGRGNNTKLHNSYSCVRSGTREDLGMYFRSGWEANYARYLNFLISQGQIQSWKYESKCFRFEGIKRGVLSYTPDFEVTLSDGSIEWHEVKGRMDDKSKVRIKRFAQFYPDEKFVLIDADQYKAISEFKRLIPNWE